MVNAPNWMSTSSRWSIPTIPDLEDIFQLRPELFMLWHSMLLPVQVGHHIHIFNAGCSKTTTVSRQLYTTQIFCYGWIARVVTPNSTTVSNFSNGWIPAQIFCYGWMDTKSFPMNGSNFTQLKYLCYEWIPRICLRINEPTPLFVNARCETGGNAEHEDDF